MNKLNKDETKKYIIKIFNLFIKDNIINEEIRNNS